MKIFLFTLDLISCQLCVLGSRTEDQDLDTLVENISFMQIFLEYLHKLANMEGRKNRGCSSTAVTTRYDDEREMKFLEMFFIVTVSFVITFVFVSILNFVGLLLNFLMETAISWLEILWQQAVPSQIFNSETINTYYDWSIDEDTYADDEDDGALDLNEQPQKHHAIDDGNVMGIANCSVCLNGLKNRVLIPCGHCLCAYCADRIGRKCPICRMEIKVKNVIHYHV
jgi:Zinc finger, C3HC4 type (RING finger)